MGALEHRSPDAVADRIYNCYSSKELIDEGLSETPERRLFETGWSGGKATHFVEPLFLLDHPAELTRLLWASIRVQP